MANLRKSLKRGLAALLAVCVVLTSFNVTAWADGTSGENAPNEETPAKFVLKYDANEFINAAQEAINSGETFSAEEMEFAKSDYNKLFNNSEAAVFEFYPEERKDDMADEAAASEPAEEIAALDDVFGADVRMFLRVKNWNPEAEDEYVMTGEEEIIFLFINATEDKLTFQIDINGYITNEITVPGNTSSIGGFGNATGSNADTKAPNNKVDTNVPGKNDGAAVPTVPETAPVEQPTTEAVETQPSETAEPSEAVEPTETLPVESSEPESTEQTVESSEAVNPAESTESSETTEAPTEAEVESSTAASEESTAAAEETESATTEAATEAETTEEATEAEVTEVATEAEVTEAAAEEPAVTEEATEAEEPAADAEPQITMSLNRVPVVGSAPQEVEEENTEEEDAPAVTVSGNLSGKTLGVTQIAEEEEVRSKAFVTTAGQIMGLMKVASGEYTLTVERTLKVKNANLAYYLFEESTDYEYFERDFVGGDIYFSTEYPGNAGFEPLKSENIRITKDKFTNGKYKISLEYKVAYDYILDMISISSEWYHGEPGSTIKKEGFPKISLVDEVLPEYFTADGYGVSRDKTHQIDGYRKDSICYGMQNNIGREDKNKHYVVIKYSGVDTEITYMRCDIYNDHHEEINPDKKNYMVKYAYQLNPDDPGDEFGSEVVQENRFPKNVPTEYNGRTIIGWYFYDKDGGRTDLYVSPSQVTIKDNMTFYAVLSELSTHKVTFESGEHGSFTNTEDPSAVVFNDIVSGTAWNDAGITEPEVTAETGYSFIGWKPALPQDNPAITKDLRFVAQYKENPNGQLVVRKQLDATSLDSSRIEKFSFKAEFKGANEELSYVGGTDVTEARNDDTNTVTIEFKLADGEYITFSNIAKDVEFTITELKFENEVYVSACNDIKLKTNDENYLFNVLDARVKGNLKKNIENEITFVNHTTVATGDITVNKEISGKENVNGTFIFEIVNIMPEVHPGSGTRAYATVNVVDGVATPATLTKMPVGSYRIKEISQLGYELSGFTVDGQSIASEAGYVFSVKNSGTNSVTVVAENEVVDTKYFTDSDLAVNQAVAGSDGEIHFQRMEADGTKHKEPVKTAKVEMNAVIPNNKTSNFGDDGFDDGDTPLTNC